MNGWTPCSGLMAFWAGIDDDYVLRFQEWHNCEHMPERVSTPGFRRGRRYRDASGAPVFLMMYEVDSPAVLASEPYMAKLNAPTAWTKEALTHFRNPHRGIYVLQAAAGAEGLFCATWLTSLRFKLAAGAEAGAVQDWLRAMAACPGVGRVQLWAADVATSGIVTNERKIYGGSGPGEHLLLLIEGELPHAAQGDVLAAGDDAAPALAQRSEEVSGRYWLEMYLHENH